MTELLKQSVVIFVIGVLLSLGISLYIGTQEFNYYCHEAQLGNLKYIYFSGKGAGLGGFDSCFFNTPTINFWVFILGSTLVVFIIQLVWLWSKNEWSILKRSYLLLIFILLSTFIVTCCAFIFPQVIHNFSRPGTELDRWTWYATTPITVLLIFLGLALSNLGPWIAGLFLQKIQVYKATHTSRTRFIWFILVVVEIQIAVFANVLLVLYAGGIIFTFFIPPPSVSTSPPQIYITPEMQPRSVQNTTPIKRTLNLPSPGVKPGIYNINSNSLVR